MWELQPKRPCSRKCPFGSAFKLQDQVEPYTECEQLEKKEVEQHEKKQTLLSIRHWHYLRSTTDQCTFLSLCKSIHLDELRRDSLMFQGWLQLLRQLKLDELSR